MPSHLLYDIDSFLYVVERMLTPCIGLGSLQTTHSQVQLTKWRFGWRLVLDVLRPGCPWIRAA